MTSAEKAKEGDAITLYCCPFTIYMTLQEKRKVGNVIALYCWLCSLRVVVLVSSLRMSRSRFCAYSGFEMLKGFRRERAFRIEEDWRGTNEAIFGRAVFWGNETCASRTPLRKPRSFFLFFWFC